MADRRPYMYMCGVPRAECSGSLENVNVALGGARKLHSTPEEAFNCHRRYLISQGWTQTGPRTFSSPDGGPVRVLTKKSRFGAALRNGKEGTRNMSSVTI